MWCIFVAAKIGFFYLVFYGVLAAMFAAMLMVFFQTLDPRIPRWRLEESLIGTNPGEKIPFYRNLFYWRNVCALGLGFRPMPEEPNLDSSLIWYQGTQPENYEPWTKQLDRFLEGENFSALIAPNGGESLSLVAGEVSQGWARCVTHSRSERARCTFLHSIDQRLAQTDRLIAAKTQNVSMVHAISTLPITCHMSEK